VSDEERHHLRELWTGGFCLARTFNDIFFMPRHATDTRSGATRSEASRTRPCGEAGTTRRASFGVKRPSLEQRYYEVYNRTTGARRPAETPIQGFTPACADRDGASMPRRARAAPASCVTVTDA